MSNCKLRLGRTELIWDLCIDVGTMMGAHLVVDSRGYIIFLELRAAPMGFGFDDGNLTGSRLVMASPQADTEMGSGLDTSRP